MSPMDRFWLWVNRRIGAARDRKFAREGLFAGPSVADIYRAAFNEQGAQVAEPSEGE